MAEHCLKRALALLQQVLIGITEFFENLAFRERQLIRLCFQYFLSRWPR